MPDGQQQQPQPQQQAMDATAAAAAAAQAAGISAEVARIGHFGEALINTVSRQNELFQQMILHEQQRNQHRQLRDRLPPGTRSPQWGGDSNQDPSWNMHLQSFNSFIRLTGTTDAVAKELLVTSVKGAKSNLLLGMGPGAIGWDQLSYEQLQAELTAIFRPAAEQSMARAMYKERKQTINESVQSYASAKKAMYLQAYPDANAQIAQDLINDFISGMINPDVIRSVLNRGPFSTLSEATNVSLQAVGTERELVQLGFKKDTTGLESQATYNPSKAEIQLQTGIRQSEPMDVNALAAEIEELDFENEEVTETVDQADIQQYEYCLNALTNNGVFAGNCFRCGVYGHAARTCTRLPNSRRGGRAGRARGGRGTRGGRTVTTQYRPSGGPATRSTRWPTRDNKGKFLSHNRRGGQPQQNNQGLYEMIEGEDPSEIVEPEEPGEDFRQEGV